MKRIFFLLPVLLGINQILSAQLSHPDTACLNSIVNFLAPINNTYYSWQLNTDALSVNVNAMPSSTNALGGSATANASWTTMQRDMDGNWYGFYTYYPSGSVHRLNFGSSPLNVPTDNVIGSYTTSGILQGLDIVHDKVNNKWYGFVVGGSDLVTLNFGAALNNTPTSTTYNFPNKFYFPHQIGVKKFDKDWIGFIADRNGSIVRLDFTSGLASQPIATNLPTTNYSSPCNFSLCQSNGNWYMLVPSLLEDNKIALLNFGSNIKNNTPASSVLGGQIANVSIPRSMNLFSNCSNDELLLYIINESGGLVKLDFDGQITNNVSSTYLGNFADGGGVMTNFVYDNKVYGLKTCLNGTLELVEMFDLPQSTITKYMDETFTNSFTQAGETPLRLMVDPGLVMGTSSYCEQIFLKDCNNTAVNDAREDIQMLGQSFPNPSSNIATINVKVDKSIKNKAIIFKDQFGKVVHIYELKEKNNLQIDLATFPAGIYYYSLSGDGRMLGIRKMVVIK